MSAKTVGQKLRHAREAMGASIEEASGATRIRAYYIEALEKGDFSALPSPVQVRGFLRAYAKYLDLEAEDLFADLEAHARDLAEAPKAAKSESSPEQAAAAANGIYQEIGQQLRARRQGLELSLEEVEQHTHIPEHYIQRMENGGFDRFPSPTQARGMLNNYANFLGMQTDAVMGLYAEALQSRRVVSEDEGPSRQIALPSLRLPANVRSFLSADLILGGLIGLALIVFVVWSIGRVSTLRAAAEAEATAPALVDALSPTETPLALVTLTPQGGAVEFNLLDPTAGPEVTEGATTQVASNPGSVSIQLFSNQRTYLRVVADGQVVFDGRTLPSTTYSFTANGQISLLTGNGAALRLFIGNQDQGLLGIYGEVVELVFNAQGVTTPTTTPTPTLDPAAETGTAESTGTGTATPSGTPTPTVDAATATP